MAARRLIIVMLVLLGVSTAIAIVAPDPVEQTAETGQTGTTGATGETGDVARGTTGATGGTPGATGTNGPGGGADGGSESGNDRPGNDGDGKPDEVELSNEGRTVSITTTVGGDQVLICVRPDSRLILNLRTNRAVDISIPKFGRTETANEFTPAVFDLLLPDEPGGFAVEELGDGRRLATITSSAGCGRVGTSRTSPPAGAD